MPYYGFNGGSPGNEWVKTASGWKKLIALRENLHRHIKKIARDRFQNSSKDLFGEGTSSGTNRHGSGDDGRDVTVWAPSQSCDAVEAKQEDISQAIQHEYKVRDKPQASFVMIPRSVGARGTYFTIGEIICKLDFSSAVRDHRRFNYVCKLLELIVATRFSSLSGLAQKNLFYVLEEVLNVVTQTQQNMAQLRGILCGAIIAMNSSRSSHIGCPATWKDRMALLQRWLERLNTIQVKEREDDGSMIVTDLPNEVLRRILNHLSNARDIVNLEKTCYQMHLLATENILWRNLCHFHFTEYQMSKVCKVNDPGIDWKGIYRKLHRRHPMQEVYSDMLQICGFCSCLFWMNGGHPCTKELLPEGDTRLKERPELTVNVHLTPQQFLDLFPAPH